MLHALMYTYMYAHMEMLADINRVSFCYIFTEEFMTLNKAKLFQLTRNSQFNIRVSALCCLIPFGRKIVCLGGGGGSSA